jgi:hypothetical protein
VASNTANTVVTTRDNSNLGNAFYGIDNTVCMVWNCLGYRGRSNRGVLYGRIVLRIPATSPARTHRTYSEAD